MGGILNFQGVKAVEDQDGGFVNHWKYYQKTILLPDLVLIKTNALFFWGGNVPRTIIPSSSFRQRYNGGF